MSNRKKPAMHAPVKVQSSRGPFRRGRFAGTEDKGPGKGGGLYYRVNLAEKGQPADIRTYRPGAVTLA